MIETKRRDRIRKNFEIILRSQDHLAIKMLEAVIAALSERSPLRPTRLSLVGSKGKNKSQ
jgi:hypothetical protein